MQAMARFFDWINSLLGVESGSELLFHPIIIILCLIGFVYSVVMHMKYFAIGIAGLMGGALIFKYFFPEDTSNLPELIKFVAAMGGLALVLLYLGFIKD